MGVAASDELASRSAFYILRGLQGFTDNGTNIFRTPGLTETLKHLTKLKKNRLNNHSFSWRSQHKSG